MSLEGDVQKGLKAKAFLESEVYRDAYGKVRQAILDRWAESPIGDKEGQHELRLMLKVIDDLNGNIVSVVNTGKLASQQIEESKTRELAKRAMNGLRSLVR
jgi:hypothetical protein